MITREELYAEIWELSLTGVSKKHEINYAALKKICDENDIPYPSSGYWTRKKMGKDVSNEVVLLPGDSKLEIELTPAKKKGEVKKTIVVKESDTDIKPVNEAVEELLKSTKLEFLDDEERKRIFQVALELQVKENTRLHKKVVSYRTSLETWKKNTSNNTGPYSYNYRRNIEIPVSVKEVSKDSWPRMLRIMDALYRAIEELGGVAKDGLFVKIKNDEVGFHFAESDDKVPHELTKQEAKLLVEYKENVKLGRWASKPNIRKYDHIYNGKLRIVIGEARYIKDSDEAKLEERLADMLILFYEEAEKERIKREAREEQARIRAEEERKKQERIDRYNIEVDRTIELINKAEDYKMACCLRAYIDAIEIQDNLSDEQKEWLAWARKKADWYDPTIARDDEFFGKRKHEETAEKKQLRKANKYGYYW